jgi:[ribosomal protein S18]-alanine N-acetyltransferase
MSARMESARDAGRADVKVRDMTSDDIDDVVALENACYTVPWSEATFRGLLRRRDADMIVLHSGREIVGYAVFWAVLDQGELGNVAISARWRGRGLGAQLVAEVIRRAARRGVREVFLEVRPLNTAARKLYERFGFTMVGRRRNYYQEPVEDALVMRRPIHPPSRSRPED